MSHIYDLIPAERLTSGIVIIIPGFGAAEVYGVRFDGEGYAIDYCTDDSAGWDSLDTHYVKAGECVEHADEGAPRWLRSRAAVTDAEWDALEEAEADLPPLRPGVDALCHAAVADALGLSMALAAE